MKLDEIRTRVQDLVNFTPGQIDQDFPGTAADSNRDVDWAINEAYTEEVELGKLHGSQKAFRRLHPFTWPADTATMPIPTELLDKDILFIRDNSDQTPGPTVATFDDMVEGSGLRFYDRVTWGLVPTPGAARSYVVVYMSDAEEMKNANDEPELLPRSFHRLIVWSAAILLKEKGDEEAPQAWTVKQQDIRLQLWRKLSKGRPQFQPPQRIRNDSPDVTELF